MGRQRDDSEHWLLSVRNISLAIRWRCAGYSRAMVEAVGVSDKRRSLVDRPRLVSRLVRRFEQRLTIVVGGGGAGKTTLLHQAVQQERINLDVVYTCTRVDRDPERLLFHLHEVISSALGIEAATGDPCDAIAELVLAQSPQHVCLIIDDAHRLDRSRAIDELLERLPSNGHVLLAGRRRPSVDTARLDASGNLTEITQADLLMTSNEQVQFANLRGVDVALLEGAEGWPAFVELASAGSQVRSRRYLQEEALRDVDAATRADLAAFAFVGGGDDAIARAVANVSLESLVGGRPLVRWVDDGARLHDLWGELLDSDLTEQRRRSAALAAAVVHRDAGRFDQAIDLATSVGAWEEVTEILGAAVRDGVDGGLQAAQLRRWRAAIPASIENNPVVVLIDGLIAREVDPTSDAAWELLDRAASVFEAENRCELALVALMQLAYAGRIRGDLDRLKPVMDRARELATVFPTAASFLAFGDAWTAMSHGRPDLQLAAMESVSDADLPLVWRVTRDHLIAHALFNLGRPGEALAVVPRDIETLPMPIPGALVTESQCLWNAGHPDQALRRRPGDTSPSYGARDRYIAGGWNAVMHCYAGDLREARRALDVATANLGENPSVISIGQAEGLRVLMMLVNGDESEAADKLEGLLELMPLGDGRSAQFLRNSLPIPYVLVPASRSYWHETQLGTSLKLSVDVSEAFVEARAGRPAALVSLRWPEPGVVASMLPCPWAIEFALLGLAAGRQDGRRLGAWLCEHWGEPARASLRRWVNDDHLGSAARDILSTTPTPPDQPAAVRILGQVEVLNDGVVTGNPDLRRERVRALLAALVVRPDNSRERLAGQLWPDQPAAKAAKNLRTTLGYLHGLLEPRRAAGDATWYVRVEGHRVRLHPELDVDIWRFVALLDEADRAEQAGKPHTALPLLIEAVELWSGDLAADLDLEWLELERIHLRSRFVRASCRAAELLVATRTPKAAIDIVRRAIDIDPWHQASYRALAAAYTAIGDSTSARAVLNRGGAADPAR